MNPGNSRPQIRHYLTTLASVGGLAAGVAVGAWVGADRVSDGLQQRAQARLDGAGLPVRVRFDGRDAHLTGSVATDEEARSARILVADLPGTLAVDSRVRVTGTGAAATAGAPSGTTRSAQSPGTTSGPGGATLFAGKDSGDGSAAAGRVVLPQPWIITFDSGNSELSPAAQQVLGAVAAYLKAVPTAGVDIEGNSDSVGSGPLNRVLSAARANVVAARLTTLGIAASRLRAYGYADTRPVASNTTSAGRAANRRVEIDVRPEGVR